MKTIITIQHTQAVHHTNGMVGSWTDWELTDLGKEQAENIGKKLSAELKRKKVKIYSSDLIRAKQTAEPLARYFGVLVEYRVELREHNLGEAVGKSWAWFDEHAVPIHSMDDRPLPDAECGRDVWNRMSAFCDEIMATDNEIIILVAHGFNLHMWFAVWQKWDIAMFEKSEFSGKSGGVSWMAENEKCIRVIQRLNDMSYICGDKSKEEFGGRDISYKTENFTFSYRVSGILVRGGKVLLQAPKDTNEYAFPGGQVAFGETCAESLAREWREEVGVEIEVGELKWVEENLFPWGERFCHQICPDFIVTLKGEGAIPLDGSFQSKEYGRHAWGHLIEFHWIPLGEVKKLNVYPAKAAELLPRLCEGVRHIVYREG
ncbi:MAG: histidine phosphatase family protein [Oscillospiraceae bacterium]|jgi:probable phosphoglycerate mutase|nr:histidine phosphatase family protein [Oscillospiraceae bacterium]